MIDTIELINRASKYDRTFPSMSIRLSCYGQESIKF